MANYDQIIYDTAIQEGVKPEIAKYIIAQARLESSDYTSNVFNCNFNMYGMKYAGQALASGRGTIAPASEIKTPGCKRLIGSDACDRKGSSECKDRDFYAKYSVPENSIRDTIQRYYKKTMYGVSFDDLNNSTDVIDFAKKLKKRRYFGESDYDTTAGNAEALGYAAGLKAKLVKISIIEFYNNNKKVINYTLIGLIFLGLSGYGYYLYKKNVLK